MTPPRGATVVPLAVLADDRSGAIETAGALAPWIGGPVTVTPWSILPTALDPGPAAATVVDLGSRHLDPAEAGQRARAAGRPGAAASAGPVLQAHKIDSTLRGNWAHEVVARLDGGRLLVVPALPARGRTCVDGEVRVDGVPVHRSASGVDVAGPTGGARPAVHLLDAFARIPCPDRVAAVSEFGPSGVGAWLRDPHGATAAVVDASTDRDLDAIAATVASVVASAGVGSWPLVAGSSATIAAFARVIARDPGGSSTLVGPSGAGGVIVVRGSRHPAACSQVDRLRSTDVGIPVVVIEPDPSSDAVVDPVHDDPVRLAARVARDVAASAHRALAARPDAVMVVLGGDTAAAVLGDHAVEVVGTLGDGASWGRWRDRVVVVRPGGFGDADALVRLVRGTLR